MPDLIRHLAFALALVTPHLMRGPAFDLALALNPMHLHLTAQDQRPLLRNGNPLHLCCAQDQ